MFMKTCLLVFVSSLALAQKMPSPKGCPAGLPISCLYGMKKCPGSRDWTTGEQIAPDFCIPEKIGHGPGACWNHCPKDSCPDGSVLCQRVEPNGCPGSYICHPGRFCPVECDWSTIHCPGCWGVHDGNFGQITPDTCIPRKDCNGCWNHCPTCCNEGMKVCPGNDWSGGCKGPEMCSPVDAECPN